MTHFWLLSLKSFVGLLGSSFCFCSSGFSGFFRLKAMLLKTLIFRLSLLDSLRLFLLKRSCSSRRASCASSKFLAICNSSRKTSFTLRSYFAEASKNLHPFIDCAVVSSTFFRATCRWTSKSHLLPTSTTGTCVPKINIEYTIKMSYNKTSSI